MLERKNFYERTFNHLRSCQDLTRRRYHRAPVGEAGSTRSSRLAACQQTTGVSHQARDPRADRAGDTTAISRVMLMSHAVSHGPELLGKVPATKAIRITGGQIETQRGNMALYQFGQDMTGQRPQ